MSRTGAPTAPPLSTYAFRGTVWYSAGRSAKESLVTTIRIDAPSREIAQAILDNYGMEAPKPVRAPG